MMAPSFAALGGAIDHRNEQTLAEVLDHQTITTRNACHAATGSSFVEVTLEVPDALSFRHPHRLVPREMPEGYAHEMPAAGREMVHGAGASEPGHVDAGKRKHDH